MSSGSSLVSHRSSFTIPSDGIDSPENKNSMPYKDSFIPSPQQESSQGIDEDSITEEDIIALDQDYAALEFESREMATNQIASGHTEHHFSSMSHRNTDSQFFTGMENSWNISENESIPCGLEGFDGISERDILTLVRLLETGTQEQKREVASIFRTANQISQLSTSGMKPVTSRLLAVQNSILQQHPSSNHAPKVTPVSSFAPPLPLDQGSRGHRRSLSDGVDISSMNFTETLPRRHTRSHSVPEVDMGLGFAANMEKEEFSNALDQLALAQMGRKSQGSQQQQLVGHKRTQTVVDYKPSNYSALDDLEVKLKRRKSEDIFVETSSDRTASGRKPSGSQTGKVSMIEKIGVLKQLVAPNLQKGDTASVLAAAIEYLKASYEDLQGKFLAQSNKHDDSLASALELSPLRESSKVLNLRRLGFCLVPLSSGEKVAEIMRK